MAKTAKTKRYIKLSNFSEFIGEIEKNAVKREKLWFRGVSDRKHTLVPSLFRHPRVKSKQDDFVNIERNLLVRFKQRSMAFHSKNFSESWDWIFFMQHYGIPTRLLDWTENPFVALFFALNSHSVQSDAVVWMLDPVAWNRHTLRDQSYKEGVLSTDDSELKSYSPPAILKDMKNHPVAIYGAHNSPRIVAQRGAFMVFGRSSSPMESVAQKEKYPEGTLTGLLIPKGKRKNIVQGLLSYGFTESVVFPDLDGLAREMRREFGF